MPLAFVDRGLLNGHAGRVHSGNLLQRGFFRNHKFEVAFGAEVGLRRLRGIANDVLLRADQLVVAGLKNDDVVGDGDGLDVFGKLVDFDFNLRPARRSERIVADVVIRGAYQDGGRADCIVADGEASLGIALGRAEFAQALRGA